MNKLQMAHEFMMKKMETETIDNHWELFYSSWRYADAMQAEADKRLKTDVGNTDASEWQPDWSQAPENTTHWGMELGSAYWLKEEGNGLFCKIGKASLFGYTGNQQGSLRKRPQ